MAGKLILTPFKLEELDSLIMQFGNQLDVYMNFTYAKYKAKTSQNNKNVVKVGYFDYGTDDRAKREEDQNEQLKFFNILPNILSKRVTNIMKGVVEDENEYNTVCEVKHIPEVLGVTLNTYGYKVGALCAEKVYIDKEVGTVDFVMNGNSIVLNEEQVKIIADRFVLMDIAISDFFGYSYYNKYFAPQKNSDGDTVRPVSDNTRRYGNGPVVKDVSSLMRNLTDFIPVAFKWVSYSPIWTKDADFMNKLMNETILGADWFEVPNKTKMGHNISSAYRDSDSVTFYTTKRRLHQIVPYKFDGYNFKFMNNIVAGLFLDGRWVVGTEFIASKEGSNDRIVPLQYEALTIDERSSYKVSGDSDEEKGTSKTFGALNLINATLGSMSQSTGIDVIRYLAAYVRQISFNSIKMDVAQRASESRELFKYIS